MPSGQPDTIKAWVADSVKREVSLMARDDRSLPAGATKVTMNEVGPLEIQIRVVTETGAPRYFSVKVTEHY